MKSNAFMELVWSTTLRSSECYDFYSALKVVKVYTQSKSLSTRNRTTTNNTGM